MEIGKGKSYIMQNREGNFIWKNTMAVDTGI